MKAKVLKRFKDKYTGEVHNAEDVITVTKKRFAEILETAPLVEEVADEKKEDAAKQAP